MNNLIKLQIGKKGLTQNFIEQVRNIFDKTKTKFLKISLLKSARKDKEDAKDIGEGLVRALGQDFTYKLIGYTLSLRKWRKIKRDSFPRIFFCRISEIS